MGPVTLEEAVVACRNNPELVAQYNRLFEGSLGAPRTPIDRAVDEATGYAREQQMRFIAFVDEYVWRPLLLAHLAKAEG
jgi:hypothetical protein